MDTKAELQKIYRLEAELEQVVQKQKALRKEGGKDTGKEVRRNYSGRRGAPPLFSFSSSDCRPCRPIHQRSTPSVANYSASSGT